MTVGILIPIPREFVLTAAASTLAGAELYVYENLTTTPVSLFSDRACTTPAANPIVSVAGFFPRRYMASAQLLTLTMKNTAGSTVHSDDYVDPGYGSVHQGALFNPVYDLALTTAGGTTAYTATTGLSLTAYTSGQSFLIKMNATNTGASTLNVDGLGAKSITKNGTTALVSGDLVSGTIYRVAYDGTQFQVVSGTTLDATLAALAALTISATTWIKGTGTDTFAVESASTTRTSLGLGTAATQNTGTSGGNVPLLNGTNTHSGVNAFTSRGDFGTINIISAYTNHVLRAEGAASGGAFFGTAASGGAASVQVRVDRTDNYLAYFMFGTTGVGSITTDTVNTAYNTTSDYRLKENIVPIEDALSLVLGLRPVTFNFIGFDRTQGGFIAHEVQELIPEAVHGERDATEPLFSVFDANGARILGPMDAREAGMNAAGVSIIGAQFEEDGERIVPQGLDMAKIVPYAVAAIQSLAARVEALEAA